MSDITDQGGTPVRLNIKTVRNTVVIATIDGIDSRDAASALKGQRLYVDRAALPNTDDNEFYHADLIGLAVTLPDGARVGQVGGLHNFGAGDLIEIAADDGADFMVPFTREVVPVVDLVAGRIVVDPPPGLRNEQ